MIDPLYGFVFAGLFTPGPNVILLTTSGARFGFRRTVPQILGVALGVGVTAGLTGLGFGALLVARPSLEFALKCAAAAWILWMAWGLVAAARAPEAQSRARPFTLIEAVLFQWVNPKVWAVALAAASGFPSVLGPLGEAARLGSAFSGINLFVCLFWTLAGVLLARLLASPRSWRVFSLVMGLALGASALLVFL